MSIDLPDLRAGLIDKAEAQRRRGNLEQESKLYGAMDGAMKFVKGDAIAGMLIAFVNIVAGIAIGVGMRGMSLGESADTYSILSVGDGMVAQIPSLFVSIAAGLVIALASMAGPGGLNHLGVQIAREILGCIPVRCSSPRLSWWVFCWCRGCPPGRFCRSRWCWSVRGTSLAEPPRRLTSPAIGRPRLRC